MNPEEIKLPQWLEEIPNEKSRNTIAQVYRNSLKINPRIEELRERIAVLVDENGEVTNEAEFREIVEHMPVIQSGLVTSDNADIVGAEGLNNEDPTIMMASASKRFMIGQVVKEMEKLGIGLGEKVFQINHYTIIEALIRERDYGSAQSILEMVPEAAPYFTDGKLNVSRDEFNALEIKVDFKTLSYLVLTLSGNSGLTIAMGTIYKAWEDSKETASRRESQDKMAALIQAETAKDYEMRIGADDHYIEQPGSNSEPVRGLIIDVESQMDELQAQPDNLMLSAIENNASDFGFDFTNSDLGKALIAQGYKIYEKTGSFPSVYWMPKLAEQGFPPHLVMLTTVSLVSPTGKRTSFVYYEIVHMPYSPDPADAEGDVVNKWPDEEGPRYGKFAHEVEMFQGQGFRERMAARIQSNNVITEG